MKNVRALELGDWVSVEGHLWVVSRFSPWRASVLLRPTDGQLEDGEWFSLTELARCVEWTELSPEMLRPIGDEYPPVVVQFATHLQEILDGTPCAGDAPRPQFRPDLPVKAKIAAKLSELNSSGQPISESTLRRRLAAFRRGGAAGLAAIMEHTKQRGDGMPRVDSRIAEVIVELVGRATNRSTATCRGLINQIKAELRSRYPDAPHLADFSERSFRRWLEPYVKGRSTFGNALTRRTTASSPNHAYMVFDTPRIGHVEIDSTVLALQVLDDEGKPFRPTLTWMVDTATRTIPAWNISAGAPAGFDHALLLARAMCPPDLRPGRDDLDAIARLTLPEPVLLSFEELRRSAPEPPYARVEEITLDGGTDFRGSVFESACRKYGVTMNFAPPRTPTDKARVERSFGTVGSSFLQYLSGFTGTDVAHRGQTVDPLWTLPALEALFEIWYRTVYLDAPHQGLRDPHFPKRKWTPRQRYSALMDISQGVPIPFSAEDYLELMPGYARDIRRDGIQLHNRVYDSRHLDGLRARRGPQPGGKWEVKWDPTSPHTVWVYHPDRARWVAASDKKLGLMARSGFQLEVSRQLVATCEPISDAQAAAQQQAFIDLVREGESSIRKSRSRSSRSSLARPSVSPQDVADAATHIPVDLEGFAADGLFTQISYGEGEE